jgi:hypothetical protein
MASMSKYCSDLNVWQIGNSLYSTVVVVIEMETFADRFPGLRQCRV